MEERLGVNVRIGEGSRRLVAVRWWPGWLLLFLGCPLEFRNNLANWPSIKPLFRPYRTWFETGCFCALYSTESLLLRVSAVCWVCLTNEDKISDPWLKLTEVWICLSSRACRFMESGNCELHSLWWIAAVRDKIKLNVYLAVQRLILTVMCLESPMWLIQDS